MAIKSKNLLTNNPKIKYISLALLILSLAVLFETLFNLKYNFSSRSLYKYVSIPKYFFFGNVNRVLTKDIQDDYQIIASVFSILSLLFIVFYYLNINTSKKLEEFIKKFTFKWNLESLMLIILITIAIRYNIWTNSLRFYDNMLIFMDIIILFLTYILIQYLNFNKNNLYNKSILYKFTKDFISKQNKKSLNKKIATLFMICIFINFISIFLLFVFLNRGFWFELPAILFSCFIISLPLSLALAYIYNVLSKKFTYIEYISANVRNIESGNLKYQLKIDGKDEISNLATSINNITKGLDVALENQIKSEKMKTELITNVSHDLKTPLTSIVNYVDILKNNDLDNDTIKDYINILDRKSQRLKALVEDIFEASKISSGDIELNIEKTDIKELLIQSIVELDDKIEDSKLDFIINTPDIPVFTMIDGKRMFRVFENLINNILKYSLEKTRVYIDMYIEDKAINIVFKNISNHKLNMKPEELLERFRRGDVSRNTDGSGLGLSIAQNLVSLQNGSMDLYIDGDLFKVLLKFNIL